MVLGSTLVPTSTNSNFHPSGVAANFCGSPHREEAYRLKFLSDNMLASASGRPMSMACSEQRSFETSGLALSSETDYWGFPLAPQIKIPYKKNGVTLYREGTLNDLVQIVGRYNYYRHTSLALHSTLSTSMGDLNRTIMAGVNTRFTPAYYNRKGLGYLAYRPDGFWKTFITITCNPNWFSCWLDAITYMKERLNVLLTRLRKKYGKLRYFWVLELTKSGLPHLHIILDVYDPAMIEEVPRFYQGKTLSAHKEMIDIHLAKRSFKDTQDWALKHRIHVEKARSSETANSYLQKTLEYVTKSCSENITGNQLCMFYRRRIYGMDRDSSRFIRRCQEEDRAQREKLRGIQFAQLGIEYYSLDFRFAGIADFQALNWTIFEWKDDIPNPLLKHINLEVDNAVSNLNNWINESYVFHLPWEKVKLIDSPLDCLVPLEIYSRHLKRTPMDSPILEGYNPFVEDSRRMRPLRQSHFLSKIAIFYTKEQIRELRAAGEIYQPDPRYGYVHVDNGQPVKYI